MIMKYTAKGKPICLDQIILLSYIPLIFMQNPQKQKTTKI